MLSDVLGILEHLSRARNIIRAYGWQLPQMRSPNIDINMYFDPRHRGGILSDVAARLLTLHP